MPKREGERGRGGEKQMQRKRYRGVVHEMKSYCNCNSTATDILLSSHCLVFLITMYTIYITDDVLITVNPARVAYYWLPPPPPPLLK